MSGQYPVWTYSIRLVPYGTAIRRDYTAFERVFMPPSLKEETKEKALCKNEKYELEFFNLEGVMMTGARYLRFSENMLYKLNIDLERDSDSISKDIIEGYKMYFTKTLDKKAYSPGSDPNALKDEDGLEFYTIGKDGSKIKMDNNQGISKGTVYVHITEKVEFAPFRGVRYGVGVYNHTNACVGGEIILTGIDISRGLSVNDISQRLCDHVKCKNTLSDSHMACNCPHCMTFDIKTLKHRRNLYCCENCANTDLEHKIDVYIGKNWRERAKSAKNMLFPTKPPPVDRTRDEIFDSLVTIPHGNGQTKYPAENGYWVFLGPVSRSSQGVALNHTPVTVIYVKKPRDASELKTGAEELYRANLEFLRDDHELWMTQKDQTATKLIYKNILVTGTMELVESFNPTFDNATQNEKTPINLYRLKISLERVF
jgi:hypothetical protein